MYYEWKRRRPAAPGLMGRPCKDSIPQDTAKGLCTLTVSQCSRSGAPLPVGAAFSSGPAAYCILAGLTRRFKEKSDSAPPEEQRGPLVLIPGLDQMKTTIPIEPHDVCLLPACQNAGQEQKTALGRKPGQIGLPWCFSL